MATSSIFKSTRIRTSAQCRGLVKALEASQKNPGKPVVMEKKVRTLTAEQVRQIFGEKEPIT